MFRLVGFMVGVALFGCADSAPSPQPEDADGKADGGRTVVSVKVGNCSGEANDGYHLSNVRLTGNRLLADARYGGGCAPHTFKACFDGTFTQGSPAQATLTLHHDGHGDICEAIGTTALSIDLTALGNEYKRRFQTASGQVRVKLDNHVGKYDVKTLTSTQLASSFVYAKRGAVYISESDSEPTWLSTTATGPITGELVLQKFRSKLDLLGYEDNVAFTVATGNAARDYLSGWSEYDADDEDYWIESAQAFQRIKDLFEGNLTDLTFVRVGPGNGNGGLAQDAGAYNLVILGKTIDGKVAGFFVVSVET